MELSQPHRCISSPWSSHKTCRNRILRPAAAPRSWLEPLEQRLLFTQTLDMPMITEFLAANNNGLVTLALDANPGGSTLSGTLTVAASGGIATFSNVSLDKIVEELRNLS